MSSETVSTLQETVEESILGYLRKMGYRQSEDMFLREKADIPAGAMLFERLANAQGDYSNYFALTELDGIKKEDYGNSMEYDYVFGVFSKWVLESLDGFRDELLVLLYPVLAHLYLDLLLKDRLPEAKMLINKYRNIVSMNHAEELAKLELISEARHVKENAYASTLRTNKLIVTISSISFRLLIDFLIDSKLVPVMKIVNQFINLCVAVDRSKLIHPDYIATSKTIVKELSDVELGVRNLPQHMENEIRERLKADLVASGLCKSNEHVVSQLSSFWKTLPVDQEGSSEGSPFPRPEPLPAEVRYEADRLKQLSGRARLSTTTLPSIFCYTLHNSSDQISSIDISPDSSLIAIGNMDSYIDVWSLKGEKLRGLRPSTELAAMDLNDLSSLDFLLENEGSISKRLIGHSGPVYSCKFMLANNFMVSASQDMSLRLWNLKTYSNVVAYKGHMGVVWDVDVSPFNYYFASASADRSAAFWCTEYTKCVRLFAGHYSDVDCVRFHPNGSLIATGSSDRTCRIWDVRSGDCVRLFGKSQGSISSISISPNGKFLVSGDHAGQVKVWDIAEGKVLLEGAAAKASPISSVDICKDSRMVCASLLEGIVSVWDVNSAGDNSKRTPPIASYPTKATTLLQARYTSRNSIMVSGCFQQ